MDNVTKAYRSLLEGIDQFLSQPPIVERPEDVVTEIRTETTVPEHLQSTVDDWDHHWRVDADTKANRIDMNVNRQLNDLNLYHAYHG
jgi:hypothetical protein